MKSKPYQIVVDTREQSPWQFGPDVETAPGSLASGDYSLAGLEHLVAIERKSLADLVGCVGPERERFCRELKRLEAYRCRAVVVEATLDDVLSGRYRSKTLPRAVVASTMAWQCRHGIPFVWAGCPEHAADVALEILHQFHRQCCQFAAALGFTQSPASVAADPTHTSTRKNRQDAADGNARPHSGKF